MPISDWLRKLILGEEEEPVSRFVPVPPLSPSYPGEPVGDSPSTVMLKNLGTDIDRGVVSEKPFTGPIDSRPRIGPAKPKTVEEKLAEIREQTGVPDVIAGPGDLARKQLELDQQAQELADPVFQGTWDKAAELGTGIEDASMQGLQEIALHPQGLFGDAPARLVGSMLPSENVGPDGMPLRDEEGRLQGFPLKSAATNILNYLTGQTTHINPTLAGLPQQGFIPGLIQSGNETVGEAVTDPSDMLLGAATAGLGGAGAKALAAMQFPALAESAGSAYENFENLPNKGLNTQTGKALASLVTQGAMASAAGKHLGDIALENVEAMYPDEGPRFNLENLTEKAFDKGNINYESGDLYTPVPDLQRITLERERRAGIYEDPTSRGRTLEMKFDNLSDDELVALDRLTDGLLSNKDQGYLASILEKSKAPLERILSNDPEGISIKSKLAIRILNKLSSVKANNPLINKILVYGYEAVKEMDPSIRDPLLKKVASLTSNADFIPDETTARGSADMADIYMQGVEGWDKYQEKVKELASQGTAYPSEESFTQPHPYDNSETNPLAEFNYNPEGTVDDLVNEESSSELQPVESMETAYIDELLPEPVPVPQISRADALLDEMREGKLADAFAEGLEARTLRQDIQVSGIDPNTSQVSAEYADPTIAKSQEISTLARFVMQKLGMIDSTEVRLDGRSAVGSVLVGKGAPKFANFNPREAARDILITAAKKGEKLSPEQIVERYIDRVITNAIHENMHLKTERGHDATFSGYDADSPLVEVDELGRIKDTGKSAGFTEGDVFNQLNDLQQQQLAQLKKLAIETFKGQLDAQDIINIANQRTATETSMMPSKIPPERITEEPDLMRMTTALQTGKDPVSSPAPTKPSLPPDPIDHIAEIHAKLSRGEAIPDFKTWSESLPDELKSKAPEIWKEALGTPDDIIAKSKTPFKSLIALINARYPNGSKDAQAKILTKMITDSKFLDQDTKNGLLKNLPYQTKQLNGTGNVPPGGGKNIQAPPPTSPTPNKYVKSSTDWVKYNQAIPVRQDKVAQDFQHLPQGMAAIHAFEADPTIAPDLVLFFDKLYKEQKEAGVQIDYTEDYLHHAYEGTPEQLQKYREWLDSQGQRSITLKPGHTLHRMFDTYREAMKFGLKPKFKNLADIAALYYGKARRAILDAELVNYLKTTIDPKTKEPMLSKVRRAGYSPLVNFPGSRVLTKDGYVHVEYYAPTEIATQVNNFNSDALLPLRVLSGLASKARNLMLGAGIPGTWINMHGLNIENRFAKSGVPDQIVTSTIQGVGEAAKLLKDPTGRGLEDALKNSLDEIGTMIERGGVVIRPRKFYFDAVEKSLREVLGETTGTGITPVDELAAKVPGGLELARKFGQAGQVIEHLFDKPLFERLIPYMMKQRYYEHLNSMLESGMDEQEAHETAGKFVNTMFGADNWQASTNTFWNNPNTHAFLQSVILAPQWFGSNVKMMGKIPKSFFSDTPESKMYRGYAKKFMTLFILTQMLGAGGTGGSEFQIPAGDVDEEHERQIRPYGTAEDWVRLPFELLHKAYTRSDWDAAAKILRNRMHPFVRSGLELITGKDLYTGQALTGSSVPEGRKLLNIGKTVTDPFRPAQVDASWELLKKVTPIGKFSEENQLGRVKSLEEIAYDFTEAPVGVYEKKKPISAPPFELFNFNSRRKKPHKGKPKFSL